MLEICTARNKEIFEGVNASTKKVSGSAKTLWVDSLSTRGMKSINKEPLIIEERTWIVDLLGYPSSSFRANHTKKLNPPRWQIRMSNEEFQTNSLFFYGASKGNPGPTGEVGVIYDPTRNKQKEYAWGIERATKNGAE